MHQARAQYVRDPSLCHGHKVASATPAHQRTLMCSVQQIVWRSAHYWRLAWSPIPAPVARSGGHQIPWPSVRVTVVSASSALAFWSLAFLYSCWFSTSSRAVTASHGSQVAAIAMYWARVGIRVMAGV